MLKNNYFTKFTNPKFKVEEIMRRKQVMFQAL